MKRVAHLLALTVGISFSTFAVDTCATTTLAQYAATGYSCTLGDRTFSNFSFVSTGGNLISESDIEVRPWADNSGFTFVLLNNTNRAEAGTTTDFTIKYMGTNTDGLRVGLGMVAAAGGTGTVNLAKDACNGSAFDNGTCAAGGTFVDGASLTFPPDLGPTSFLVGRSHVNVFGVREQAIIQGGNGFAALDQFDNFYQTVPEPATYLLMGAGLIGLVILHRRKQRA